MASSTGGAGRRRPCGVRGEVSPGRALLPTCRRVGTLDDTRGGGGSWSLGMAGSSLLGGGAALGGGAKKPPEGGVGMGSSSGERDSLDFLLEKENCDLAAAVPFFIAVREGTRRPRGRFSESKIAMFK